MGRYDKHYDLDFSNLTRPVAQEKPKHDPLADFLHFAGSVAPAVGTVGGGLLGTFAAPGIGTAGGAALGGAAGAGLGAAANYGADMVERGNEEDLQRKQAQDEEEAARHRKALEILGDF